MDGIERIKTLASEIKDEALLEIINYLVSREDMNEKYLNEEKSLAQMVEFIKGEARKQEKNGMAMIKDEVVFGWAIHYFDESNADLGLITKKEEKNSTVKDKMIVEKEEKALISEKTVQKVAISEPKTTEKEQNSVKSSKKTYVPEGQLTLF